MGETDSEGITAGFVVGDVLGFVFGFVFGFVSGPVDGLPLSGFVVNGGFGVKPGVDPNTNINETRTMAARTATVA